MTARRVFRPNEWCSKVWHVYQWLHTLFSKGKLARAIDCEFTLKSIFQSFLASSIGKPNRVALTCSWHLIDWGGCGSFMDQSKRWKNRCNLEVVKNTPQVLLSHTVFDQSNRFFFGMYWNRRTTAEINRWWLFVFKNFNQKMISIPHGTISSAYKAVLLVLFVLS